MAWEDYDDALKTAKELGRFHRSVERDSGNTIYMFDSEGNYLELHFPRPGGRQTAASELMVIEESTSPRRTRRARSLEMKIIPTFVPFVPSW